MTPKEKARQLFDKYNSFDFNTIVNQTHRRYAKQCALIAVDELIESHLVLSTTHDLKPSIRCKKYWQEVKQEIEAL